MREQVVDLCRRRGERRVDWGLEERKAQGFIEEMKMKMKAKHTRMK